jgi:class 3 adenylate cyclase
MAEERAQRRLAAIIAADVVGYSRLMEQDEADTLAILKARRKAVLEPLVSKYAGRIFKTAGDGVLIEFASAVNAVQCAIELQQGMAAANAGAPDRHIVLRIGINLGDVMVEGSDLYGDGINIAARLEGVADPGSIVVSGTAYDHVRNKINAGFDDIGNVNLKNIAQPVRAYRVAGTPTVSVAASRSTADKPAIAVLPFVNMSGDAEQEYFARRRLDRGHHHRPVAGERPHRHRAHLQLCLQGPEGRHQAGRARAGRWLRSGGKRAPGGRSRPGDRAADRRRHRPSCLG